MVGLMATYSCLIVYLRVSCYKTAEAAFGSFITGVQRYCIPSQVTVDDSVENGLVTSFMNVANREGRGSAIQGKSVYNQPIERLWTDVRTKVKDIYIKILWALEQSGALDIENQVHVYAIQFVIQPSLNRVLEEWSNPNNNHKVRTIRHRTPQQQWLSGLVAQHDRASTAMSNIAEPTDIKGVCSQVVPNFDIRDVNDKNQYKCRPCADQSLLTL
ncbi:hypothetical protein DPMN_083713 [Dreissena polymorpha]|uniref:Integrase core domain-containing protein n=1 Tax=Dreissena polymorpha TaxID=45954 RepID=A0A9D4BK47_DREPO|nr:hypothetical protein DPMN_083713 [Dreissena polymorpha]